jgi:hypothetical protein
VVLDRRFLLLELVTYSFIIEFILRQQSEDFLVFTFVILPEGLTKMTTLVLVFKTEMGLKIILQNVNLMREVEVSWMDM